MPINPRHDRDICVATCAPGYTDAIQHLCPNETNYCPTCQNGGRLLADRALSRLLKKDWPKTLEELEEYKAERKA